MKKLTTPAVPANIKNNNKNHNKKELSGNLIRKSNNIMYQTVQLLIK